MKDVLKGLSCVHTRMRRVGCSECVARGRKCRLECPECGLTWMDEEDGRSWGAREKSWLKRDREKGRGSKATIEPCFVP